MALSSSLKLELFCLPFLALGIAHCTIAYISWFKEGGGRKYFCRLSLFDLLYDTNFLNKLQFNDFLKINIKNNLFCTVQIVLNLENPPIFRSGERLVKLERGRECFVGLSSY